MALPILAQWLIGLALGGAVAKKTLKPPEITDLVLPEKTTPPPTAAEPPILGGKDEFFSSFLKRSLALKAKGKQSLTSNTGGPASGLGFPSL